MTQVTQELASVRLEAEKLLAENESLNKNYESLLKVRSFPERCTESLFFSLRGGKMLIGNFAGCGERTY